MRYVVKYRGDPFLVVDTLVTGFIVIRDEFKKRWPTAMYGQQEAAAHGFTLEGVPELTAEEARALREDLRKPREPWSPAAEIRKERQDAASLGAALRPGRIQ